MTVKEEATYVLQIKITDNFKKNIGKLGKIFFEKGEYVYIGSAKGCLHSRLGRHLKKSHHGKTKNLNSINIFLFILNIYGIKDVDR